MIALAEILAVIIIPILLGCIFVLPLLFQVSDIGFQFIRYWKFLATEGGIGHAVLFACGLNSIAGVLAFPGWRRLCWAASFVVFGLAIVKSESCRMEWEIWRDNSTIPLYRNYFIQISLLILIPVQVHLWRIGVPIIRWARGALVAACCIQTIAVLTQFLAHKTVGLGVLAPLGLAPHNWLLATDSTQIHAEALRFAGFFRNPNSASMLIVLTWPALLQFGPVNKRNNLSIVLSVAAVSSVVASWFAVLLTYSRAGYVGLFLQFLCILVLLMRRKRVPGNWVVAVSAIALAVCFGLALVPGLPERVAAIIDTRDASLGNRTAVYKVAVSLMAERPIAGWGPALFNTLYNRFYKLPHERYAFIDAHSGILHAVFEIGIVGAVLFLLPIIGFHSRRALRSLPPYAYLGPIGCMLPLFSDNPSAHPGILFPLLWISGIWVCSSISEAYESTPRARLVAYEWKGTAIVISLFVVWLMGYSQEMQSSNDRFERRLQNVWRGHVGTTSFYIKDLISGRYWGKDANEPRIGASSSKLPIAGALLWGNTSSFDVLTTLPLKQAYASGSGLLNVLPSRPPETTIGDALYLMLAYSDNTASNALMDLVGVDSVSSYTAVVAGRDLKFVSAFGRRLEPDYDGEGGGKLTQGALFTGAMISARQVALTLVDVVETSTTLGKIAESALARNVNRWGLFRHLDSRGTSYHKSGTTRTVRNDALLFRSRSEYWVIAVMREDKVPRVGVDQFSYRALGEMAWQAHLYFQNDISDY